MAYTANNGILNGQPSSQLGMVSWTASKTSVGTLQAKPHFIVAPGGFMSQTFSVSRFSGYTPVTLQALMAVRITSRNRPGRMTITLTLVYRDAYEEIYTIPIMKASSAERLIENIITTSDVEDRKLLEVHVYVLNTDNVNMYIASMKLFPSTDHRDISTDPGGDWDDFSEKAILYGLEVDMPILR